MGWFRPKIRLGTALALIALALNLTLSFGHHHFDEAAGRGTATNAEAARAENLDGAGHSGDSGKGHQDPANAHPCLACVVVTAAAIAVGAPPLAMPAGTQAVRLTATACLELQQVRRAVFEARAPPRA
jgi:hypothetical protein